MHNPDVRWNDIIGLDAAKRLVKEAVVYPIMVGRIPSHQLPVCTFCSILSCLLEYYPLGRVCYFMDHLVNLYNHIM